MDNLIFDRTLEDVNKMKDIIREIEIKGDFNLVDEDKKAIFNELQSKSSYDYQDLNRVGQWVKYLSDLLNQYNYHNQVEVKVDWKETDIITANEAFIYLDNIENLKEAYVVRHSTPTLPNDLEDLTYEEANNIEKILYDTYYLIKNMVAEFRQCGTFFSGESEGLI